MSTTWNGSSSAVRNSFSQPSSRRCSASASSGRQKVNISTLSNQCTRKMPRVSFPYDPASRRKQDENPAYRFGPADRSRISSEWYAARATSDVPTR